MQTQLFIVTIVIIIIIVISIILLLFYYGVLDVYQVMYVLSLISNISFFCSFMILYSQGLSIGIKLTGLLLSKWVER